MFSVCLSVHVGGGVTPGFFPGPVAGEGGGTPGPWSSLGKGYLLFLSRVHPFPDRARGYPQKGPWVKPRTGPGGGGNNPPPQTGPAFDLLHGGRYGSCGHAGEDFIVLMCSRY